MFFKPVKYPASKVCNLLMRRYISMSHRFLQPDYYKVLGVSSTASTEEIKQAYIKKCKEYHPDRHQGNKDMQAKFVQVNDAYKVLSNAAERREYNARIRNTIHSQSGYHPHSPYGWGRGPQARPEDVFRQYQWESQWNADQNVRHSSRGRKRTHRDPMYDYWDHVYRNEHSFRDNSPFRKGNPFHTNNFRNNYTYEGQSLTAEQKRYMLMFFGALFFMIYIRIVVARKSLRSDPTNDPNFQRNRHYDKDLSEINTKTVDA